MPYAKFTHSTKCVHCGDLYTMSILSTTEFIGLYLELQLNKNTSAPENIATKNIGIDQHSDCPRISLDLRIAMLHTIVPIITGHQLEVSEQHQDWPSIHGSESYSACLAYKGEAK